MRLSAYSAASLTPRIPPQLAVLGTPLPAATHPASSPVADERHPGAAFVDQHGSDVFALQGLTSYGYRKAEPGVVSLRFDTVDHARLADALLQDTVLGARLVFTDPAGKPLDMTRPYSGSITDAIRSLAAMPGVIATDLASEHNLLVRTASQQTAKRLEQLVVPSIGSAKIFWQPNPGMSA